MDIRVVMTFDAWGSTTNRESSHDIRTPLMPSLQPEEGRERRWLKAKDTSLISNSLWPPVFLHPYFSTYTLALFGDCWVNYRISVLERNYRLPVQLLYFIGSQ